MRTSCAILLLYMLATASPGQQENVRRLCECASWAASFRRMDSLQTEARVSELILIFLLLDSRSSFCTYNLQCRYRYMYRVSFEFFHGDHPYPGVIHTYGTYVGAISRQQRRLPPQGLGHPATIATSCQTRGKHGHTCKPKIPILATCSTGQRAMADYARCRYNIL